MYANQQTTPIMKICNWFWKQEIFDDWARKVQQRNLGVSGRIFAIENTRSRTGKSIKAVFYRFPAKCGKNPEFF